MRLLSLSKYLLIFIFVTIISIFAKAEEESVDLWKKEILISGFHNQAVEFFQKVAFYGTLNTTNKKGPFYVLLVRREVFGIKI